MPPKQTFSRCDPEVLKYMQATAIKRVKKPTKLNNVNIPGEFKQLIFRKLDLCTAACLALTCKIWYKVYREVSNKPIRLNHLVVLKSERPKRRGEEQEVTFVTLRYLLQDFMGPYWKWDPDHGIFRSKDKAGTAMTDDEFQEYLKFNRSRGQDRDVGWRGMGEKVILKGGIISKIWE